MSTIDEFIQRMRAQPAGVRSAELKKVCEAHFGKPRQSGSSQVIYKTPWPGDSRVNILSAKGEAKPYQVRQVLLAIDQLAQIGKAKNAR